MNEQETIVNNYTIKYKFKAGKYDNDHLIVIFSGFGAFGEFTYDFENALQVSWSNILWIKDDFNGHCCYYLCENMNFAVEKSVIGFIENMLASLNLDKSQCTVAGFSKGGSAALYYGIKYDFKNIVSTVPQFKIGSYTKNNWSAVSTHMMGYEYTNETLKYLDSILPNLLRNDSYQNRNIYLLTSKADPQFKTEIEPYLNEFFKFNNMNFFMSESFFVRAHNQVTSHHVQFLLGLFFMLDNNVSPKFGFEYLRSKKSKSPINITAEPIVSVNTLHLDKNILFIEGVGILRGVDFNSYEDVDYKLRCKDINTEKITDLTLAKGNKPNLTKDYFNGDFVVYDKAWFYTTKYQGVRLGLEYGSYKLFLCIHAKKSDISKEIALSFAQEFEMQTESEHKKFRLKADKDSMELTIE